MPQIVIILLALLTLAIVLLAPWLIVKLLFKHEKHRWIFVVPFLSTAMAALPFAYVWIVTLAQLHQEITLYGSAVEPWAGAVLHFMFLVATSVFLLHCIYTAGLWLYWRHKRKREQKK